MSGPGEVVSGGRLHDDGRLPEPLQLRSGAECEKAARSIVEGFIGGLHDPLNIIGPAYHVACEASVYALSAGLAGSIGLHLGNKPPKLVPESAALEIKRCVRPTDALVALARHMSAQGGEGGVNAEIRERLKELMQRRRSLPYSRHVLEECEREVNLILDGEDKKAGEKGINPFDGIRRELGYLAPDLRSYLGEYAPIKSKQMTEANRTRFGMEFAAAIAGEISRGLVQYAAGGWGVTEDHKVLDGIYMRLCAVFEGYGIRGIRRPYAPRQAAEPAGPSAKDVISTAVSAELDHARRVAKAVSYFTGYDAAETVEVIGSSVRKGLLKGEAVEGCALTLEKLTMGQPTTRDEIAGTWKVMAFLGYSRWLLSDFEELTPIDHELRRLVYSTDQRDKVGYAFPSSQQFRETDNPVLRDALRLQDAEVVLDLFCGTAGESVNMAEHYPNLAVLALDANMSNMGMAVRNLVRNPEVADRVTLMPAFISQQTRGIPLGDGSVGCVTLFRDALHYIEGEQLDYILEEALRVTGAGGSVFIDTTEGKDVLLALAAKRMGIKFRKTDLRQIVGPEGRRGNGTIVQVLEKQE